MPGNLLLVTSVPADIARTKSPAADIHGSTQRGVSILAVDVDVDDSHPTTSIYMPGQGSLLLGTLVRSWQQGEVSGTEIPHSGNLPSISLIHHNLRY